jgi:hypothetical protein
METTPGFLLFWFSILYIVDGATPDRFAKALMAIFFSRQRSIILVATASFVRMRQFSFTIYRKLILEKTVPNRVGYIPNLDFVI